MLEGTSFVRTNEEEFFLHYQASQNQHGIWQQCDSRKLLVHIEQQHELPEVSRLSNSEIKH